MVPGPEVLQASAPGRRRHMVVVAAVLVVVPDQQRLRPAGPGYHRVDDLRGELLPGRDVLRVLLRLIPEVRLDQAEPGQVARRGVGEELRYRDDLGAVVLDVQLR